ncbi:MAG: glycine--tRNA ligase subunit beta [Sphingomonas sp.]|uniref:glycine--tRNA ligase subunit beta n=1 Tax=Sphingomonas sp. TaxID=28214 RepID=UPI00179A148C|nr:glycine--tRNA ligase subunit beta [Sphingomonas sp.]MBA3666511.1 glycine--tRNA ligase subunit beta [Sphingomonas sp.]
MSADFLLELLSEEIPARMQAKARNDLARMMAEALTEAGLSHGGIISYSTPRRLALIAKGLPASTEAASEELKGPKTSAPPQALDGFLRKTGLKRDQLQDRDGTWFAVIEKQGRATADVLAEAVAAIVRDFPWPKSMRWGAASSSTAALKWVRPLHSIVALLGEEIVPVAIDGVACGAATLGHRFHHPGPITIGGASDYVEKLRACHVIVDQEEREAIVRNGAVEAAENAGFLLVEDEGLVVENAGLTEWPVPLLGSFDPEFLDVPEEVIALTARINQKYFVMRDGAGKLAPHFVCTANIDANDGGDAIVAGNERVLAARLSDARFFWEQDLKVPLEEQAKKLEQIVFHEKLGTVADKVERVAKLARWLVDEGIVKGDGRVEKNVLADEVERAARLAKADLVTGMVGEFPELQGVIGGHLARAQGEPDAVADAVRDHYKPVGQGDGVPTAPVTVAVSLADKLDTVFEFFGSQNRPSGSKDPYAIRRSALGVIELLLASNIRLKLKPIADEFFWWQVRKWNTHPGRRAYGWGPLSEVVIADEGCEQTILLERTFHDIELHTKDLDEINDIEFVTAHLVNFNDDGNSAYDDNVTEGRAYLIPDWRILREEIVPFFAERLKVQQREAGVRHDLIDAVFALGGEDDLVRLLARVRALQAFVETKAGKDLLAGYKRAANILKKESWDVEAGSQSGVLSDEAALMAALDEAEPKAEAAIVAEDFAAAMSALASLRAPIDAFFETVTVNDSDQGIRARRLNLLARFRDAVHRVADFSKIEG